MKQTDLSLNLTTKRTRKQNFLAQMERVVSWAALVELLMPYALEGKKRCPSFAIEAMLYLHYMQQWLTQSNPAMEEASHDVPLFRESAGLNGFATRSSYTGSYAYFVKVNRNRDVEAWIKKGCSYIETIFNPSLALN